MRKWRIEDSSELYNISGWGINYFSINDKGNVIVTPRKDGVEVDLKEILDELQLRDIEAPVLLRFPDILDNRIEKISTCFKQAAEEYNYKAQNHIIYPIKVNQMRPGHTGKGLHGGSPLSGIRWIISPISLCRVPFRP